LKNFHLPCTELAVFSFACSDEFPFFTKGRNKSEKRKKAAISKEKRYLIRMFSLVKNIYLIKKLKLKEQE
jgi:hypothetical protein